MKRHPALLILSREHHAALSLALAAKRAVQVGEGEVRAVARRALACYRDELLPHFAVEEETLLPLLEQAGEVQLVRRTLDEHRQLHELAATLASPVVDGEVLRRFGELLADHVRFEERELFDAAQARGVADGLPAVESRSAAASSCRLA
ncbi:hypothetical protein OTERR_09940 [Oryzomicrobium terrae]|uniref:Hemerythrin-like domain-containing protein n=1 Tax=Oryzomicrobium terrae TaxID=1735038 RepID=A0A5C1E6E8_9RHOO|nr:hemerythrin domain-containing protein [Oryzomicrobium terrae]QEL64470.1 hypothetical protein OTERR_09940 [Oryzomicrobium terrae]